MPRERTHWEGCWRERTHHECALDRVAALEAELARVKGELRQANNVRDVFAQAVVQTATGEYEELANERKRREDAEEELAKRTESERLWYKIADSERERRGAAEALLTEARFYMPGHYDFIKPNGGLRDLMCRVDEYFGNQPID